VNADEPVAVDRTTEFLIVASPSGQVKGRSKASASEMRTWRAERQKALSRGRPSRFRDLSGQHCVAATARLSASSPRVDLRSRRPV